MIKCNYVEFKGDATHLCQEQATKFYINKFSKALLPRCSKHFNSALIDAREITEQKYLELKLQRSL